MSMRFEGSYLGDASRIADDAVLECKICWMPYDPELGDDVRQIPPGTPFRALPHDWRCPVCDGDKSQFMVVDAGTATATPDPAEEARLAEEAIASAKGRLIAAFREVFNGAMRDVPLVNHSLNVECISFRVWEGQLLGILLTPWFMNLILMPGPGEEWADLVPGEKEDVDFPSGVYEFIHCNRPGVGGYKACSLFSPVQEFASQLHATEVARAVMNALFDPAHRDDVAAPAEPEAPAPVPVAGAPERLSRRRLLMGSDAGASSG